MKQSRKKHSPAFKAKVALAALEAAVHGRKALSKSVFDAKHESDDVSFEVENEG